MHIPMQGETVFTVVAGPSIFMAAVFLITALPTREAVSITVHIKIHLQIFMGESFRETAAAFRNMQEAVEFSILL